MGERISQDETEQWQGLIFPHYSLIIEVNTASANRLKPQQKLQKKIVPSDWNIIRSAINLRANAFIIDIDKSSNIRCQGCAS